MPSAQSGPRAPGAGVSWPAGSEYLSPALEPSREAQAPAVGWELAPGLIQPAGRESRRIHPVEQLCLVPGGGGAGRPQHEPHGASSQVFGERRHAGNRKTLVNGQGGLDPTFQALKVGGRGAF